MDENEILAQNKAIDALSNALNKFNFYNDILANVDVACKSFASGQFSYEMSESVTMGPGVIGLSRDLPKSINFGILYSIDNDIVRNGLATYRELFNINSSLIESIEENLDEAVFNNENYYLPTFDAVGEINSIYELDDSLGDYICETAASYFCREGIVSSDINSDLLLNVLDKMSDEAITAYMFNVKAKLREIQSLSPYSEVGLEIYQKPTEKKSVVAQMSEDYEKEFQNILKNANKGNDD